MFNGNIFLWGRKKERLVDNIVPIKLFFFKSLMVGTSKVYTIAVSCVLSNLEFRKTGLSKIIERQQTFSLANPE